MTQIRQAPINVQNVITYDVVVGVDNSALKLLPGMTANVKILTNEVDAALKIPNSALRFRPPEAMLTTQHTGSVRAAGKRQDITGATVWMLDQGKPKPVRVKLGITDGVYTAVQSGNLQEGEQVIVSAANSSANKTSPMSGGGRGRGPGF